MDWQKKILFQALKLVMHIILEKIYNVLPIKYIYQLRKLNHSIYKMYLNISFVFFKIGIFCLYELGRTHINPHPPLILPAVLFLQAESPSVSFKKRKFFKDLTQPNLTQPILKWSSLWKLFYFSKNRNVQIPFAYQVSNVSELMKIPYG